MENLYKKIVDTVPVFFFIWDRKKKETVFISNKFYDQTVKDYFEPKTPQEDLRQYIHPDSQQAYDEFFASLTETNDFNDSVELKASENLSSIHWLELKTFPVIDQQKPIQYIAGHITDITKSKETHYVLEEQVKSLDIVTFMLAHELSSPTANIMGLADMLKHEIKDAEYSRYTNFYDAIYNYAGEILTMAQGLVTLIHLQANQDKLELEKTEVKSFIKKLTDEFFIKSNFNTVKIDLDTPAENYINIDQRKLSNALDQLIIFLLKQSKKDIQITIDTPASQKSGFFQICIYNKDVKFLKTPTNKVLDRGSRLAMSDIKGKEVSGMLELIIAKDIIELHNGTLELKEDQGCHGFSVFIPKNEN